MLGQLPQINQAVQGIGVIVGTQRPFIAFLMKNWPLVLIGGFAMYARGRERWKKNEFTTYNLMADAGLILSPIVGLALLNQLAQEQQDRLATMPLPPVPPQGAPMQGHPSMSGA